MRKFRQKINHLKAIEENKDDIFNNNELINNETVQLIEHIKGKIIKNVL